MRLVEMVKLMVEVRNFGKKCDYLEQRLDKIEEVNNNHGK